VALGCSSGTFPFQARRAAAAWTAKTPGVHPEKGDPAPSIRKRAEALPADLVVMGTSGRTGISALIIGKTAGEALQTIRACVLAVNPEGFVSPALAP
jgi:universal stress protein E